MFDLASIGPVPDDLGQRTVYEKVRVPLIRLFEAHEAANRPLTGLRFVDCVIDGPAVVVMSAQTQLINCNLGDVAGDARNLFLRAHGPRIIGGVPLNDAVFDGCLFRRVGIVGDEAYIQLMIDKLTPPEA